MNYYSGKLFLIALLLFATESISAQIYGCTDPLANNYNTSATNNDGSCLYDPAAVAPVTSVSLDAALSETSGLIYWNERLLTHNDNGDTELYALDTVSGVIIQQYALPAVINYDWEDIASDSEYIYVGDFGNNVNGNRTDLHILRIEKSSLLNSSPLIDTIYFSYSDQTDFTPTGGNNTDFDCEAFIVSHDSIFLFSKQWVSNRTTLYSLPKVPGNYITQSKGSINVQGLITGATYLESQRVVALCAYTNLLQPFIYLLYDFTQNDFFGGNKRSISMSLPFHQVEGITTNNGLKFYCTNENFVQFPVNTPQKLHTFDLSSYLSNYLDGLILNSSGVTGKISEVFPVPALDKIRLQASEDVVGAEYDIMDQQGRIISTGKVLSMDPEFDLSAFSQGIYFLRIASVDGKIFFYKFIRQ